MRPWITLIGVVLPAFLAACSNGPDGPPIRGAFTSVQAVAFPCRGSGPCPPGQVCAPPPPCAPQYEVSAMLHLSPLSGDPAAVTSFSTELFDVHANRIGSVQEWSVPAVPFTVGAGGSDVSLSYLTGQGAEIVGGSLRVVVTGADGKGARWDLRLYATVQP
jgi:hypothetical protein